MNSRREPRHLAAEGRAGGLRKPFPKSRLRRIWEHFRQDLSEQEQKEDLISYVETDARNQAEAALVALGADIYDPMFRSMIEMHAWGAGLSVRGEVASVAKRGRGNPGSDTFVRWAVLMQYQRELKHAPGARLHTLCRRTAEALGPGYTPGMIARAERAARREIGLVIKAADSDPLAAAFRDVLLKTLVEIRQWLERDLPMESPSRQMH